MVRLGLFSLSLVVRWADLTVTSVVAQREERDWQEVISLRDEEDPRKFLLRDEEDMLTVTEPPSAAPSSTPSVTATPTTSYLPTPPVVQDDDDDGTYFNYHPLSPYGPHGWKGVTTGDALFFDRFVDVHENECDWRRNSPIDLTNETHCTNDHQVHTRRGKNDWDTVAFEVLPHALRARFNTLHTNVTTNRTGFSPARADFSNLSDMVAAYYLDLKIPSEHTMNGTQYHGEIHIGHKFEREDNHTRSVNLGMFLDPTPNLHHPQLEEFIRAWEEVLWERKHRCRYGNATHPVYQRTHPVRSKEEMERIWIPHPDRPDGLADWDLYQLLSTVWYYGYEGSFTVPPCTNHVYWRFLDMPASISWEQYRRLERLVLGQVHEETCRAVRVAHNGGINRPLQHNRDKTFRCTYWKTSYREDWLNRWPDNYHGNDKVYRGKWAKRPMVLRSWEDYKEERIGTNA